VVAASGMVTGGRILSYLERYISLPENHYSTSQKGLGKKIARREPKKKDLYYPVEAKDLKRRTIHADQKGLLNWPN
jgi:metallo-beta-lactamase family protein